MNIKILDASKMKQSIKPIQRYEIKESAGEKCTKSEIPIKLLPKEMVSCIEINCERIKKGMTDNCVICENINKDIFFRCKTRYEK